MVSVSKLYFLFSISRKSVMYHHMAVSSSSSALAVCKYDKVTQGACGECVGEAVTDLWGLPRRAPQICTVRRCALKLKKPPQQARLSIGRYFLHPVTV